MDQHRIGAFISELRKERGLTQKELADKIGVSDKTVSKWETSRGIPDIAYMESLCTSLGITMNELISGERLSDDAYSKKAEENIMTLMNENENTKRGTIIATTVGLILLLAAFFIMIAFGYGAANMLNGFLFYLDLPTLIILALMSFGCVLISGKRDRSSILEVLRKVSLPCGCIVTFITFVLVLAKLGTPETIGPTLAVTILSIIYSFIEYLIVILIQTRGGE